MHIPDGYLSPSTCAGLYAASAPFWYTALRRLRHTLHSRMVPLVSVFSAFSFVIMMFNLPLPGGTTGHAVGMGVAAIVLGPWASVLAVSIALLIQAVFFGDGGITAIGANCFNMAVAGSLVAYGAYRMAGWRAPIGSARRVVAAGLGGYFAINVAALLTAVEFGLQPLWFHDPSGAPLYAPYPLDIAIPAMMIGHLTIAGLAELVISAGLVAWLQRTDPSLLRGTAPDAPDCAEPVLADPDRALLPAARKMWAGLALLLILTPLGILAVGTAWGEWSAEDFADAEARRQIAAASANREPPPEAPRGLERLSRIWTAPMPDYAPAFIRSEAFGYVISGMAGVGLIIAAGLLLGPVLARREDAPAEGRHRRRRRSFIEKTSAALARALQHAFLAEETARSPGLLQRLDPRVKLCGIGLLIVAAVAVRELRILLAIFGIAVILAAGSHISVRRLASRVWLAVLLFTGVIALPAIFITPGETIYRVPWAGWLVTWQGLRSAAFLLLRAETTATLSVLLILTTLWSHLLRALRFFRIPVVVVVLLGMTFRYIFLLLQTAREVSESREARLVGEMHAADRRRLAAATAGVLLAKSLWLSGEVHTAMMARGYRGEVYLLDDLKMGWRDWLPLGAFAAAAAAAIYLGR
jgi:cobalt/nickel transport system permease protein